jgi:hypothetical protein
MNSDPGHWPEPRSFPSPVARECSGLSPAFDLRLLHWRGLVPQRNRGHSVAQLV